MRMYFFFFFFCLYIQNNKIGIDRRVHVVYNGIVSICAVVCVERENEPDPGPPAVSETIF